MNGHRLTEGKAVVAVRLTALAGRPETVREHLARLGTALQDVRAEATLLEALVVPGPETPARAGVLGTDLRTTTVQDARRLGLLPRPNRITRFGWRLGSQGSGAPCRVPT